MILRLAPYSLRIAYATGQPMNLGPLYDQNKRIRQLFSDIAISLKGFVFRKPNIITKRPTRLSFVLKKILNSGIQSFDIKPMFNERFIMADITWKWMCVYS